jgi:hypothetical protein
MLPPKPAVIRGVAIGGATVMVTLAVNEFADIVEHVRE